MKTEAKKAQEFTIKGELIGTINLTDTFQKVKELTQRKEKHNFLFVNNNREVINHWDLDRVEDEAFPILVIKPFREDDSDDKEFLI
jgi:hypothetical protein